MEQSVAEFSRQELGSRGQVQSWNSNVKISELLDYPVASAPGRLQSSAPGRQYLSGRISKSEQSNKYRASPVDTPWSLHYKGIHIPKPPHREKPTSCSLADVERKLSSLILNHTEDEIYQRHFLDADECEQPPDRITVRGDASSVISGNHDHKDLLSVHKPSPKTKKVVYRPPKQLNLPSKSSKRHRFCLSKYPHSRKNKKIFFAKEADEIQHEVTVDQKGLKEAWEFYVLGKLSNETQSFINHRFDGKEKPKERLVDFLDAGYRDKDRSDYMAKRKRRLFDMPYKHEDFPGASTHL